ncbi:hypothetical protein TFLX_04836 [Thermoflexales bacterium]|nr:hypothetical protein TFLX_04836 [Thermoflexales bacterium]
MRDSGQISEAIIASLISFPPRGTIASLSLAQILPEVQPNARTETRSGNFREVPNLQVIHWICFTDSIPHKRGLGTVYEQSGTFYHSGSMHS